MNEYEISETAENKITEQEILDEQNASANAAFADAFSERAGRNQNKGKNGPAVDMVATARSVQEAALSWQGPSSLKIVAPAKVNLFLGIGARREDGYHEATGILHAVALHDVLYMRRAREGHVADAAFAAGEAAWAGPQKNIAVHITLAPCEGIEPLPCGCADNIVFRAIDRLACELGIDAPDAIEIRLEKHIPHQAGLGGGSSDAAAALLGVAKFWGVSPDEPQLEKVARSLGSDVAFFLHGGCACFEGTGDVFSHTLAPVKGSLVLIKPEAGVSTAAAYHAFDEDPLVVDDQARSCALNAKNAADVALFNNLAAASEKLVPELSAVREWARSQPGVTDVLLCGSGSATFAVAHDFAAACRVSAAAQAKGWWARTTLFGSLRAAIVPK